MKKLLLILLLSLPVFAQDYSPKATNKEAATRMHFAITLFRGNWSEAQEEVLLRGIRDRRSINEQEAGRLFTVTQLRTIFFGIGRENIDTFRSMYEQSQIPDKKKIWFTLKRDQQIDVRRINFAWGVGYLDLNDQQIDFLLRVSKALPKATKDESAVFEAEALAKLFDLETARLLFGSIGPYAPCQLTNSGTEQPEGNCGCSIGSSFNMSCSGDCRGGSGCTIQPEGCGFAWLYPCDGGCATHFSLGAKEE